MIEMGSGRVELTGAEATLELRVWSLGVFGFEFVSDFAFRISDFAAPVGLS
ncbi:MAG: hypothetical protein GXX96_32595 [Planctomycetaceae bacterium]|nr:hypothetical protein [Planctomycetaceae bacterium]